jgi:hypothetical protein
MDTLQNHRQEFRIASAGPLARRALRDFARGKVEAVFERSFYAAIEDRWICILSCRGGMGPLNARCDKAGLESAIQRFVRVGDEAAIGRGILSIGTKLSFDFRQAAGWHPPILSRCEQHSVADGMNALRRCLDLRSLPPNGLAFLLAGEGRAIGSDAPLAAATKRPLESLFLLLSVAMASGKTSCIDTRALEPLLGLGPGLTPSGDDIIGGVIITLHLLGLAHIRDALWARLKPSLPEATNRISIAHMEAAAEGYGHEAVHDLVNAILAGHTGNLDRQLDAISALGHTSGWDTLVGIVVTASAWLKVHGHARHNGGGSDKVAPLG